MFLRNVSLAAAAVVLVFVALVVAQKLGQSPKEQTAGRTAANRASGFRPPAPPPVEKRGAAGSGGRPKKHRRKLTTRTMPHVRKTAPPVVAAAAPPKDAGGEWGQRLRSRHRLPGATPRSSMGIPSSHAPRPVPLTLPAGRHTFVARHSGYRDAQRIIDIPRDTGLIVDLAKMAGMLSVISTPPGADRDGRWPRAAAEDNRPA